MKYTDIYPVFDKLKEYEHVIFQNSSENHISKKDYRSLTASPLIERINKDIETLCAVEADRKYVHINGSKELKLEDVPPSKDTYLMIVTFQGFKYLFAKSKELYILINYGKKDELLCTDCGNSFDFLPKEGKSRRTILELEEPYTRFVVNTYSAFCGYCQIHLNVHSNQLYFKYNKSLRQTLCILLKQIIFPEGEADMTVPCRVQDKEVYVRFVKVYNLVIVVEWTEGI